MPLLAETGVLDGNVLENDRMRSPLELLKFRTRLPSGASSR